MCTSKLVYDILGKSVSLDEYEWAKGIGMIGDFNFRRYGNELRKIIAKYEGKKPHIAESGDYFKTRIGKLTELVNYAMAVGTTSSVRDMFQAYSESADIDSLEKKLKAMDVEGIREQIDYYSANFNWKRVAWCFRNAACCTNGNGY